MDQVHTLVTTIRSSQSTDKIKKDEFVKSITELRDILASNDTMCVSDEMKLALSPDIADLVLARVC